MPERFLIFGHRGSPKRFPENTLASFEEALRAGADGFETDLRILADRTAVLFHDDELRGAEFESLTLEQCGNVAQLADLSCFAGRATMILEVKRRGWEESLIEHVSAWPNAVVASFDHRVLTELRQRNAKFALGITLFGSIVDIGSYAASIGATWCFPNYRYVDAEMVSSLHEREIKVVPWTPNRVRDWERLHSLGCDGCITDLPHDAVRWRVSGP